MKSEKKNAHSEKTILQLNSPLSVSDDAAAARVRPKLITETATKAAIGHK